MVRNVIFRSSEVRKIVANAGWLVGQRVLLLLVGLTVHVWMARYLGPSEFGTLNYAMSVVGLFSTFTYLGLSGIVTRDLVEQPDAAEGILGTAAAVKLAGGILALAAIGILLISTNPPRTTAWMVVIIALGMPFAALNVTELWFQSRTESRHSVIASGAAVLAGSLFKIALIGVGAKTVAFAAAVSAQQILEAVGKTVVYSVRGGRVWRWRMELSRAKRLLSRAWPLALSSIGAVIYLKVDQVMLEWMSGPAEVGQYAVAARLSELWYFVPAAIGASVFPTLIKSRSTPAVYSARLQRVYDIMATLGVVLSLAISLSAGVVVSTLYGDQYSSASLILAIHVWTCPAVFMGAVLSKWLIMEDLLMFSFTRHFFGAVVNVLGNIVLIPYYGGVGAAVSTLAAYTAASYLSCFTDQRTRTAGVMMSRALLAPLRKLRALAQ